MSILYCFIDLCGMAEFFQTPTFLATFWYMSLAIILIVILPIILSFYKKMGWFILLAFSVLFSVLFPTSSEHTFCYLPDYLFTFSLGIVFADNSIFDCFSQFKICNNLRLNKIIKFVIYILLTTIFMKYRQKTLRTELLPIWNGLCTVLIIEIIYEYFSYIPIKNKVLYSIGVHSMNIFLIHNFIRVVWYYDFTYSFTNAYIIIIVLLFLSYLVSALIDYVKQRSGYNSLLTKLSKHLCNELD